MTTVTADLFGLPIPDAGPVFIAALTVHIGAGLTAVATGALAATARKQPGRHPRAGHAYLWAVGFVGGTATVLATIRWPDDTRLLVIAVIALGLAIYGFRARRRQLPGWPRRHAIGMGGSYIALLTGFYVDNGPFLPGWDRLPHWTYWTLPAAVGVPLIYVALRRYGRRTSAGTVSRP